MTDLRRLQQAFMDALYTEKLTQEELGELHPHLLGEDPSATRQRFEVYRRNMIFGLLRTLESFFPLTRDLLSEGNFKLFAKRYFFSTPQTQSLDDYGEQFPEHLACQPEIQQLTCLPDIARLEWHLRRPPLEPIRLRVLHQVFEGWSRWVEGGLEAIQEGDFASGGQLLEVIRRDQKTVVRLLESFEVGEAEIRI